MKIKLIFDSGNPDDMEEYKQMMRHRDMHMCLYDIRAELRNKNKRGSECVSAEEVIEKMYDFVNQTISEHNLSDVI